jgi:hypothetical protein
MFCLRNWKNNHKRAIGVIGNNTYNYYTMAEGMPCNDDAYKPDDDLDTSLLLMPIPAALNQGMSLQIPNMGSKVRYDIEWYNVMNGSLIGITTEFRSSAFGKLELPFPPLTGNESCPIVLFKVYKSKDKTPDRNTPVLNYASSDTAGFDFSYLKEMSTPSDELSLKLYPNPAGESVTLEVLGKEFDKARVDFVNLSGQIVYTQYTDKQITKFDISFFPDGFYFVQFQTDEKVLMIKFVKQ